jgi:hypothetical protein
MIKRVGGPPGYVHVVKGDVSLVCGYCRVTASAGYLSCFRNQAMFLFLYIIDPCQL